MKYENSALAIGEQKRDLVSLGGRNRHTCCWIEIASRNAAFRLRAVHSGGEDRRPAECQRPLRTPAVGRIAVPANPWLAKGASWMRDSRRGRTSRADTGKPR